MAYQNVVVVGAGGRIGEPLARALLNSTEPKFRVTALARSTSSYSAPSGTAGLDVIKVDFSRTEDLVKMFTGQDVVIFTFSFDTKLAATSKILIEAAIQAGVKRIIPSEYASDEPPVMGGQPSGKALVKKQLDDAAADGKICYTIIRNGPWFDFAFKEGFSFDLAANTVTLYNGGTQRFNTTTKASVISVILSVLTKPTQSENKVLHIHDFYTTQLEILEAVERVTGKTLSRSDVDPLPLARQAVAAMKAGNATLNDMRAFMRGSVFGPNSSAAWDGSSDDSSSFGLGNKSLDDEIRTLV